MTTAVEVNDFLLKFKAIVSAQEMVFSFRQENMNALATLRMNFEHAEGVILGLTHENYCKGPEEDHDGSSGEIWIFGATLEHATIYIKLKLDREYALCISFHPAEFPLRYPLR